MGRIGKSYPRFEQAPPPPAPPMDDQGVRVHLVGAIIGVLCALGFIGWLLAR